MSAGPEELLELVVAQKRFETASICYFELARADGARLPPFTAGAHVDVHLDGGLVRSYSLCNAPGQVDRYCIGVLRERESRGGSRMLVDEIEPGMRLRVSRPRNHFGLDAKARRTVLLAGGIGVTPLLSMAEDLNALGIPFEMHYCARSRSQMAFQARLDTAPYSASVHRYFDDEPERPFDFAWALRTPGPGVHLYICGPAGFLDFARKRAAECGWAEDQVHFEYFAATVDRSAEERAFEVVLAKSRRSFQVPSDRSIVAVLAAGGVDVPISCEQGVCGTCLATVLEGQPDHRDHFLTNRERAEGKLITPCVSRCLTSRLVLDL